MTGDDARFFSADYGEARRRFREAAAAAGAELEALALDASAPDGSPLTIDIAWLGAREAPQLLLHSSGLHGVEGFAGSAVQLALLASGLAPAAGTAIVLAHVLNPYGMAWLRRWNEHNVDLNRNFGPGDDDFRRGAPEGYVRLEPFLNPPSPPRRDGFYLRALWEVARHGLEPLKQAIVGGQYEFPRGLFFGGHRLEQGPALYQRWLAEYLAGVEQVVAVDVHTGLGRWAEETLVAHRHREPLVPLAAALGRELAEEVADQAVTYTIRGGYGQAFDGLPDRVRVSVLTEELGTYSALRVLHALREENRAHFYERAGPDHPARRRLLEAFAPRSARWRRRVVAQGRALAGAVLEHVLGAR